MASNGPNDTMMSASAPTRGASDRAEKASAHAGVVAERSHLSTQGVYSAHAAPVYYHSASSGPHTLFPRASHPTGPFAHPHPFPVPPVYQHGAQVYANIPHSPRTTAPSHATPRASSSGFQNSDSMRQLVAATFGGKVFKDIVLPDVDPTKAHLWYQNATMELRIQVVLNCIKAAGFEPLGKFLVKLLTEKYSRPSVIKTVSRFVESDTSNGTQPIDVIRALYDHHLASSTSAAKGRSASIMYPSLPRYALPPSLRLLARPSGRPVSTRQILLDWALSEVIAEVDIEASRLVRTEFGLNSRSQAVTWSMLCSFSLTEKEELLAQNAPALFAVLTTAATSKGARHKLERQVEARIAASPSMSSEATTANVDGSSTLPSEAESAPASDDPESARDAWLGVTIAILMMLFFRNHLANVFQKFLAVFLFQNNVHREVFRILGHAGLCVSYKTTLDLLVVLGEGQANLLKTWGESIRDGVPFFQFIFDNINKAHHAWQKTLTTYDHVQSGTAGALIMLEDVPPGAFDRQQLEDHMKAHPRTELTFDELVADIDWKHIRGVGIATVLRVWTHWIPQLAKHRVAVASLFSETHQKHRLRLRKTKVVTLRCSNIDESTTQGVDEVLTDVFIQQLCLLPEFFANIFLFICGDQLSIDRLRKLVWHMRKAGSVFNRRIWVRPTIQLWHMKWAWQKAIIRLHWHPDIVGDTFGLHEDCHTLGRHKYNPAKCDFYPTHHLLRDCFETMTLEALRIVCEEESGVATAADDHLLDVLASYFGENGNFHDCSLDTLSGLASKVYDRYMCNAAYDDAFGYSTSANSSRDGTVPNTASANHGVRSDSEARAHSGGVASSNDDTTPHPGSTPSTENVSDGLGKDHRRTRKGKQRANATSVADGGGFRGDQALVNTVNFMRTVFWYLEFYAAVADGDIGRVFEILKLLRFSFWGAGSTNYGNELLELACHFLKDYPAATRTALLNNYLVNPSGLAGHWHEGDLFMEHCNHWLKNLLAKKTMDFDSAFMKEKIALNLSGFQALRDAVPHAFGLKSTSSYHPDADRSKDINHLGAHYRANKVLSFCAGRRQAYETPNEWAAGYEKLQDGQLAAFLKRTAATSADVQDTIPLDTELGVGNMSEGVSGSGTSVVPDSEDAGVCASE